ncbi:serine/threonine protein kinase [Actinorhabdospora filicis]|uniref:Serine/threonine protein kinase n=1 Tax=Actinorhabdospora filicis TaxID=1785913 RepID=A0A9W6SRP3_9ACTN|nr:protein kinase family protein [Actinorhabdospora filicis]GLZ81136.1 serine/threonine protein kinase [Actinorhabdospora filicis]
MAQVGAPAVGELLADRYRLDEHINDDSTGRQVWRGTDVLLARPVTVVLRTPGGEEAQEMLTAAVAASRVNHAHIVGVYDAVDEGDRAYIVREWVEGRSLRDIVIHSPLDANHAISLTLAVAEAVAAVHASGVAHGNVHPGTVLLSDDDRVVLSDPRGGAAATQTGDVRAIGATLYCALTGLWPREVPGPAILPDAGRDDSGRILPAAEAKPGVPGYLDRLTTELLDPSESPPTAAELVDELSRLEGTEGTGALEFVTEPDSSPEGTVSRPVGKRFAYGIAGMVVVALLALLVVTKLLPDGEPAGGNPGGVVADPSSSAKTTAAQELQLSGDKVKLIKPNSENEQQGDIPKTVDGDPKTSWHTNWYTKPNFGNIPESQPGMGLLIDLGEEREITQVIVHLGQTGSEISLRAGTDVSDTKGIIDDFTTLDGPKVNDKATVRFAPDPGTKTRYLMVWIGKLGPKGDGTFQATVQEITVYAN